MSHVNHNDNFSQSKIRFERNRELNRHRKIWCKGSQECNSKKLFSLQQAILSLTIFSCNLPLLLPTHTFAQSPVITRSPQSTNPQQLQNGIEFLGIFISARQSLVLILITLTISIGFAAIVVITKKGINALGRNPLNSKNIMLGMIQSTLAAMLVIIIGLLTAFLMYRTNPLPKTEGVPPTPTPRPVIQPSITPAVVHTTTCFTVSVPFQTKYPKINQTPDTCTVTFMFNEPKGEFTLTHRPLPTRTLSEHPSVAMRRLYTDTYKPIDIIHPDYPELLTFQTNNEITSFLRNTQVGELELSFHNLSPDFEQYLSPEIIIDIISSIQIPNSPSTNTFPPLSATQSADPIPSPSI
jgi:hypothetical protein